MKTLFQQQKALRSLLLLLGCFLVGGTLLHAQIRKSNSINKVNNASTISINESEIDDLMAIEMAKQEVPGALIGIIIDGKLAYVKAYGHQDKERTRPMRTNVRFRWASISKPLTSVVIHQLMEQGKINVGAPVHQYLKDWGWPVDGKKGAATIRGLLSHTSGMEHTKGRNISSYNVTSWNGKKSLEVVQGVPFEFSNGADYSYSTPGFCVLGTIVDKVADLNYEQYVLQKIANNQKYPMPGLVAAQPNNVPTGHSMVCVGQLIPATEATTIWKLPSGGWASTITDLANFCRGLMHSAYLNNSEVMWKLAAPGAEADYKRGFHSKNDSYGRRVWHNGIHNDMRTFMEFYPDKKLGIVMMVNKGNRVSLSRIANHLKNKLDLGVNFSASSRPVYPMCTDKIESSKNKGKKETTTTEIPRNIGDEYNFLWMEETQGSWDLLRNGYTFNQFGAEWKHLAAIGYQLVDMECYIKDGQVLWDGVFSKSNAQMNLWRRFDTAEFGDKWREMRSQGYRLVDLETYQQGGTRRWNGLFIKDNQQQALWRNFSTAAFGEKWREMKAEGFRIIDIETYMDGGTRKWAGVWVKGTGQALFREMSKTAFTAKVRELRAQGFRLIDVETYKDGSTEKWAGVWERSNKNSNRLFDIKYNKMWSFLKSFSNNRMKMIDMDRIGD